MSGLFVFCVVFLVLYFLSSGVVSQSTDAFDFPIQCNYTTRCEGLFGISDCKDGICECRNGYFFTREFDPRDFRRRITCKQCPNYGERCDEANCCRHSEFLSCIDGLCRCRDSSMDSCLHFEPNTELMIAAKLALFGIILVSLAILLMVLRRSCGGEAYGSPGSAYRRDRIYASLNSIQRFVLAKMQDRPPPYDELESSSKPPPYSVALSAQERYGLDAPPPYSVSVFAQSSSSSDYPGISNPVFAGTPGTTNQDSAAILPITLPSAAVPHPCESEGQADEGDFSDLKRPVLTGDAVRRMSNYSTFTAQQEPDLIPVTSTMCSDSSSNISGNTAQGWKTDTFSAEPSLGPNASHSFGSNAECSFSVFSNPEPSPLVPSLDFSPGPSLVPNSDSSFGSCCASQETVVDWSGKEVKPHPSSRRSSTPNHEFQTTDLPFPEPSTSDDWLSSTLGPVVQQPRTRQSSDQSKLLGNLATFFISKRRGSHNSAVSDSSESDSMPFARDYYTYDDDVCSLVSHLHPADQASAAKTDPDFRSKS